MNQLKEVYFDKYCPKCKHKDTSEQEEPCFTCLAEPAKIDSHRPEKFEEDK